MNKIIFTGGGSAGHITLNLALIPYFINQGWEIHYIGSINGMEQELIKKFPSVHYHGILTGKLRRYFSTKNFIDMLKIPLGCLQASWLVHEISPDVIFSKGGFVSFPVVIGGFLNRKKIYMHESDITPGLANKMCLPFVSTFFTTFPETIKAVRQKNKVECVGPVLSARLFNGDKQKGASLTGFNPKKPTIMFIGGSLGAKSLNEAVEKNLKALTLQYQVIHITGKTEETTASSVSGSYIRYEYVDEELKDLMALADVVISRAGSNSIFELASLKKPMILVPLPNTSSRGEQSLNAENFKSKGYAEIIPDSDIINPDILLPLIKKVFDNQKSYQTAMQQNPVRITSAEKMAHKIGLKNSA